MPYKVVDPNHGAVVFKRTPEEKALKALKDENNNLKEKYEELLRENKSFKDMFDSLEGRIKKVEKSGKSSGSKGNE